jgi:hypothetical protein
MIKVIIVEVNKLPYVKEIDGDLESCQAIVGGYIECCQLGMGITLVCNEEGKLINLPPNRIVSKDIICGNFFITKTNFNTGDFTDLSEDEIKMIINDFSKAVIGA